MCRLVADVKTLTGDRKTYYTVKPPKWSDSYVVFTITLIKTHFTLHTLT